MPYIAPEDRQALDQQIHALAETVKSVSVKYDYDAAFAGILNYTCTTLALKILPMRRYWVIAVISGVFHNIADEFYRRYAAPYEDEQIARNGDCLLKDCFKWNANS